MGSSGVTKTFSTCGRVVECRVLRWDGMSPCAALVRMSSQADAEKCKQELDGTVHESCRSPLQVQLKQKSGEVEQDHVYVKGFHCTTSQDQVQDLFGKYGEVKWCRILPVPSQPRYSPSPECCALVQMGTPEECQAAIQALNGNTVSSLGVPMSVHFAEAKPASTVERVEPTPNNNLYVKGWPVGFPDFLLQSTFQNHGNVVRLRLLDNPDPDQSTCAALVQMSRIEEAQSAVKALHGRTVDIPVPPMRVKYSGRDQVPSDNLYVTSLPRTITEEQVNQTFQKFAPIVRLRMLTQKGRPETHCLVQLESAQVAATALRELDGKVPVFKGPLLSVQYAMKRDSTR